MNPNQIFRPIPSCPTALPAPNPALPFQVLSDLENINMLLSYPMPATPLMAHPTMSDGIAEAMVKIAEAHERSIQMVVTEFRETREQLQKSGEKKDEDNKMLLAALTSVNPPAQAPGLAPAPQAQGAPPSGAPVPRVRAARPSQPGKQKRPPKFVKIGVTRIGRAFDESFDETLREFKLFHCTIDMVNCNERFESREKMKEHFRDAHENKP